MSVFHSTQPMLCDEAWFNSVSIYDDEAYIEALEAQAQNWKVQYETCGSTVLPIGKSSEHEGSQEDEEVIQEEMGSDSEFDDASPELVQQSIDMTF